MAAARLVSDGKRTADIVSRIRDFSKTASAQKEDLEINEAILEIMILARAPMSEHRVLIKTELSEGLPHVLGDRVQLQQVILNLIMNAIEAMSEVKEGSRWLLISTNEAESGGVLVGRRPCRGRRFGSLAASGGPRALLRTLLYDQVQRIGDGVVDLPFYRRSA
jgi:signal transduction histidine kinase